MDPVGQMWRSKIVDCLEGVQKNFEGDTGLNWEPVKLLNCGDVMKGGSFRDVTNSEAVEVYGGICEGGQREVS